MMDVTIAPNFNLTALREVAAKPFGDINAPEEPDAMAGANSEECDRYCVEATSQDEDDESSLQKLHELVDLLELNDSAEAYNPTIHAMS